MCPAGSCPALPAGAGEAVTTAAALGVALALPAGGAATGTPSLVAGGGVGKVGAFEAGADLSWLSRDEAQPVTTTNAAAKTNDFVRTSCCPPRPEPEPARPAPSR